MFMNFKDKFCVTGHDSPAIPLLTYFWLVHRKCLSVAGLLKVWSGHEDLTLKLAFAYEVGSKF